MGVNFSNFVRYHAQTGISLSSPERSTKYCIDTNILGTEWKAINLGLLWFTGGLFSISLSVQAWIPAVRERNIVNSLIICLTGRGNKIKGSRNTYTQYILAIISGLKQIEKDTYIAKVHTMLGYILIVGSMTRLIQIIFRKSPTENLPRSMLREHHLIQDEEVLDIEDDDLNLDNSKQKRCKHRSIFASITLVSGLLASILSISAGILFMGANTGWLGYMQYYIKDPSLYINITLAFAFLWLSYIFGLCTIYRRLKSKNAILEQYEYLELSSAQTERMQEQQQPMTITTHTPILSSPPVFSPIDVIAQRSPIVEQEHTTQHEKTMRPSEYRAKRRSLLVQSPTYETVVTSIRPKSSVTFGVGGVLPDEVIVHDNRRSWVSSSGSSYSSGSNSPSFEHRARRDSLNELMDEEGRRSVHKTNSGKRKERRLKQ